MLLPYELEKKAEIIYDLNDNLFENQDNKLILGAIKVLLSNRENPDTINVYNKCRETVDKCALYLSTLTQSILSPETEWLMAESYIDELKSINHKDNVSGILNEAQLNLVSGANTSTVSDSLIASLSGLSLEDKIDFVHTEEVAERIWEQMASGHKLEGWSWGIDKLDAYTSGIMKKRLYVVGGLKKGGKSRFLINTLYHLHNQKVPTGIIELEMPEYEFTKLIYSRFAGVNDAYLRSANYLTDEDKERLNSIEINHGFLGVECRAGLDKNDILKRIRRLAKLGYPVIMIDFLQRIRHNRNMQAQELEDICTFLADATRTYDVGIILLSQYNALAESGAPTMASLKGSGGIGESADCIFLLDNLRRRLKDDGYKGMIDCYIEQRYGDSGLVKLQADLGTSTFNEQYEGDV